MALTVRIQSQVWEETLFGDGEPVVICRSELPLLSRLEERAQQRIGRCYAHAGACFQRHCRKRLFPRAEQLRRAAREKSRIYEPWEVSLTFSAQEPEETEEISITLIYERREAGQILYSARREDRWDLRTGLPAASRTP